MSIEDYQTQTAGDASHPELMDYKEGESHLTNNLSYVQNDFIKVEEDEN